MGGGVRGGEVVDGGGVGGRGLGGVRGRGLCGGVVRNECSPYGGGVGRGSARRWGRRGEVRPTLGAVVDVTLWEPHCNMLKSGGCRIGE